MILSAVWGCLSLNLGLEVSKVVIITVCTCAWWQGSILRPEMGKLKEKGRGSKKSLRKTEGKGQGRVKGTKEKRKDWKSSEVGKE